MWTDFIGLQILSILLTRLLFEIYNIRDYNSDHVGDRNSKLCLNWCILLNFN